VRYILYYLVLDVFCELYGFLAPSSSPNGYGGISYRRDRLLDAYRRRQ
jgi:hypothetical protein